MRQGSITDKLDLDSLVAGVDFIVVMLGDVRLQQYARINRAFVEKLIPAMRRHGVKRFLYRGPEPALPGAVNAFFVNSWLT